MRAATQSSDSRLGWAVVFLDVCILFSVLRTMEYLNAPVWDWIVKLGNAAVSLMRLK
jgi:hypothetical protein